MKNVLVKKKDVMRWTLNNEAKVRDLSRHPNDPYNIGSNCIVHC